MSANDRKLALDIAFPWLVPIQIMIALAMDVGYLQHPDLGSAIGCGVILAIQGTATNGKVAVWRTLPVTHGQVGRARWWQMTGLPGIGIVMLMAVALALHRLMIAAGVGDPLRPDLAALLLCLLLQFFYAVFLTAFALITMIARLTRSPLAYAALIAVWAPWLLLLPNVVPGLSAGARMLILGSAGVLVGAILYRTAPNWPEPAIQPVQLDFGGGGRSGAATSMRAGQSGWPVLCGMALLRPALTVAALLAVWTGVVLALKLDRAFVLQLRLLIPFVVIVQISQFNATGLRLLRILPGSTLTLTAYLLLLPLALLTALTGGFSLILEPGLTGGAPQIDIVGLSAPLLVSALALPAALAVRQIALSLVLMLCVALVALIQFGWDYLPAPWADERLLAGLTALAIGIGFFWMHRLIGSGTCVYRLQPFVAPRWRGND